MTVHSLASVATPRSPTTTEHSSSNENNVPQMNPQQRTRRGKRKGGTPKSTRPNIRKTTLLQPGTLVQVVSPRQMHHDFAWLQSVNPDGSYNVSYVVGGTDRHVAPASVIVSPDVLGARTMRRNHSI
ncbi:hypothetical protein H257_16416 [Aphanomyces astaci]|uniref:Uncharacterized protein n=1 Tax=Aphanomyces astaci TaxID=112090 RepID=W4FKS4_APHAT|nr:hypothetical protein H257_16416 [Aphanomyces astaci]ETV67328.1 hypothetical protein H257_16416 [Aphanomyces astaci]|eukprot:XP_009843143.1 hypothetical protein H257_16416 [Aphanomyces astaci]